MKSTDAAVGVREFRSRFSAYLREVAGGGMITIGDRRRGRPVARLIPVARTTNAEHLADLASRGLVQIGSGKPGAHRPVKLRRPTRTVADIVIEDQR